MKNALESILSDFFLSVDTFIKKFKKSSQRLILKHLEAYIFFVGAKK